MKYLFLLLLVMPLQAEELCKVTVCNKLERFTLDLSNFIQDKMGETCTHAFVPKDMAKVGQVISSESRWFQGSNWNPTKKSVTRVKEVHSCHRLE